MKSEKGGPLRILHIAPEGLSGEAGRRIASLSSARELGFSHRLVTSSKGQLEHAQADLAVEADFPPLNRMFIPARLQRLAKAMEQFDGVCSYGYAALGAVMARTVYSKTMPLPPLVHHELETSAPSWSRDWLRRIALERASALVVSGQRLRAAAISRWQQPQARIAVIPEGIDLAPWRSKPNSDILPGLMKRPGELWIGMVSGGKDFATLEVAVNAFAPLTENWQLIVFGPEDGRERLRALADKLSIGHRVHTPGLLTHDGREIGLLDVAICGSALSDQDLFALRAMACSIPIVVDARSSVADLLPEQSREFAIPFENHEELALALGTLAADEGLRIAAGSENRSQAEQRHDRSKMVAAYKTLFERAISQASKAR